MPIDGVTKSASARNNEARETRMKNERQQAEETRVRKQQMQEDFNRAKEAKAKERASNEVDKSA